MLVFLAPDGGKHRAFISRVMKTLAEFRSAEWDAR